MSSHALLDSSNHPRLDSWLAFFPHCGDKKDSVPDTHIDIHVHVKTAVDHTELLLMQINPEQVIITMADVAYTSNRQEEES
jgi:hypothetical protein